MLHNNSPNSPKKFMCELCDYGCCKNSDFEKHISSLKHKRNKTGNNINIKIAEIELNCNNCNKIYKSRVGLWRHKKLCNNNIDSPFENIILDASSSEIKLLTNLVLEIVKSNTVLQQQNHDLQQQTHDLQQQMLEVCQKIQPSMNHSNNTNTNSHNKTFNLQFFLNEQCKDAMNIMEFVDTFQLQFEDLERVGEVGYVEGISSIIIDKLNKMDIYKRPIHCSDAKREIMHIKDNNVWAKDTENNDKLRLAIKHITKKNMDLVNLWADKHPGVRDYNHRLNDKYQLIIIESVGGMKNDTIQDGESKIIKKISKMVLIDKNTF